MTATAAPATCMASASAATRVTASGPAATAMTLAADASAALRVSRRHATVSRTTASRIAVGAAWGLPERDSQVHKLHD